MWLSALRPGIHLVLTAAMLVAGIGPTRHCQGGQRSCCLPRQTASPSAPRSCCHKTTGQSDQAAHAIAVAAVQQSPLPCRECCRPNDPVTRQVTSRFETRDQHDPLSAVAVVDRLPGSRGDGVLSFADGPTAFDSSHPPLRVLLCVWRN